MLLAFGVLLGAVNKGFSQKTDATDNGKNRYQPFFPYKTYPAFYSPTQFVELRNNPDELKKIGSFVTPAQLDAAILEALNHCVALDGFTWNGGKVPSFKDASIIDSMVRNNMYELKVEKFPNVRYKVCAVDTKLGTTVFGDGAHEGYSQVLYLDPNQIPGADNPGSYHLWPVDRLTCGNTLLVDKLTEFATKKVDPIVPNAQATASTGTTVPGKTIIVEGDTIIVEGDVIQKQASSYQEPSGYKYENDYSYQPNYYGGGYSSGCGFGISAGFSFGFGSSSCGGGYYGGGYSQNYCGGGNYGGGYSGDYYNSYYYDNSINNSFNTDYDHSFNDYQYQIPFIPPIKTDLPGQQGGGYEDGTSDNGDNNGGNGGGDVPGQQGGSDDNGKWAAGSGFGRNTAASWNQKTSAIKADNSLPSFSSNKTGTFKSTGNVNTRADALWSPSKNASVSSREETVQRSVPENKPVVEYRGRSGAEEKAAEARSNTNNQSRTAPQEEMRGREGAETAAARSHETATRETRNGGSVEGIVGTRHENVGGPSSGSEGGRIATTTTASREPAPKRLDQSSNGRTNANVQASRTPNSQNSGMSQKRQSAPQGNVSQRQGTNTGSGGSVNNRPGATR